MLIKQADDHAEELAQLEHAAATLKGDAARSAARELKMRKAGLKGEADSAYQIDFYLAKSPNWAVIHDLRLEHEGRVAQIDHLVFNRLSDCYVLESKHFHAGLKITDEGEFLRWNDFKHTFEGMPSPLEQNDQHIVVLREVMKTLDLPKRAGLPITPVFHSFVLISPNSRIDRPKKFDTSGVIKADQLRARINSESDNATALHVLKGLAKIVSSETIAGVAKQLAGLHRPYKWKIPQAKGQQAAAAEMATATSVVHIKGPNENQSHGPQCKKCGAQNGSILYGKYGYYFKCAQCDVNTAIKLTCLADHNPRLRKSGNDFFRDCLECGTTQKYFANTA